MILHEHPFRIRPFCKESANQAVIIRIKSVSMLWRHKSHCSTFFVVRLYMMLCCIDLNDFVVYPHIHDHAVNWSIHWTTFFVIWVSYRRCDILLLLVKLQQRFLTYWGWDKMAEISQTTFSNAFSWTEIFQFWLKFHWSSFPRVQLTIFQHRFR